MVRLELSMISHLGPSTRSYTALILRRRLIKLVKALFDIEKECGLLNRLVTATMCGLICDQTFCNFNRPFQTIPQEYHQSAEQFTRYKKLYFTPVTYNK